LQDTFDLKDEALLKASGAMTGGIGGLADTCGSMIGATLVLGSVCGRGRDDDMPKLQESIRQAADYYTWFKGQMGTVNCRDIVTKYGNGIFYDFGDPAQARAAQDAGVAQKCAELIQNNVAEAAGILWDELYPEG
jgi:C_GCAxxG_C_C family probable redox protein